jgi:hypothetical protein
LEIAPAALVASSTTSSCAAMTGAIESATVTVKLAVPVLPAESVCEH